MSNTMDVAVDSDQQVPDQTPNTGGDKNKAPLTPGAVRERWQKGSRSLQKERRDYWINLAFILDEQWIWWDKKRNSLSQLPRDPNRVRVVINRMRPNLVTLVAKLMKRELSFEVQPTATDDSTAAGARLAEQVLEGCRVEQGWEALRHEQLMAVFLGGTAGIAVEWDSSAGTELDEDPATGEITGTGEVSLTCVNICEMALPSGIRDYRNATWWCRGIAMPPEEAQTQYKLSYKPVADASGQYSPFQQRLLADSGSTNQFTSELCIVYSYYERPNSERPQGAVGTVIGDRFVDGPYPWPFPFTDRLNIALFRQLHVPSRWTGDTLCTSVRPVQVAYNHMRSMLLEHAKLAGNARLMVPDAAIDIIDSLTDEPGEIVPFNAQAGQPYYLAPPNLPRWMMQEADQLKEEIDDIMHVHDVSRGEAASDASGVALSVLAEKDDTPMGLMAFDQSHGWADVGTMVLKLYADKATEPRLTVIPGKDIPRPVNWSGDKLQGQTRVRVPLDNVMPHSRVAQQAYATQLWDRKIITDPQQYAKLVDLPDQESLNLALDPDATKATRENAMMDQDITVIPDAWDNHGVHIAEHNGYRKGLSVSALVMTPTGPRKLGELDVGDLVIAGDGSPTSITKVVELGAQQLYRFTFRDGTWAEVTSDHLWTCRTAQTRWKNRREQGRQAGQSNNRYGEWVTVDTQQIMDRWGMEPVPHHRIELPMVGPVEFDGYRVPYDPYLLGLILGDGYINAKGAVSFTTADHELASAFGDSIRGPWGASGYKYDLHGVRPTMRALGLAGRHAAEKFVPDTFLFNDSGIRLALLQGLMDTDGCATLEGHASFCTVSPLLADDVRFLVRSLGGTVTTYVKRTATLDAYEMRVVMPVCPFRLRRKAERWKPRVPKKILKSITLVGIEDSRCIGVAHPSGLFVTHQFIVTHNSTSYFYATPEIKSLVDNHIQAHENLEAEQLAQQQNRAMAGGPEVAAMPQGNAPPGSQVPATLEERMAEAKGAGPAPAGPPLAAPGPPGPPPGGIAGSPAQQAKGATATPAPEVNPSPGEHGIPGVRLR